MQANRDPIADSADAIRADRRWFAVALILALALHVVLTLKVPRYGRVRGVPAAPLVSEVIMVDVDLPKPPPAAIEPPAVRPLVRAPRATSAPARPAQAAEVLTKLPDTTEPIDLTADGFVVGAVSSYAGGQTASNGTLQNVVRSDTPLRAPTPTPPDRSRRAAVLGGEEWTCPFPAEADADHVDHAEVTIRVDVVATGAVETVAMLSDPGHGFAREARRCASTKAWSPALDPTGRAIEATVTIRVRFDR